MNTSDRKRHWENIFLKKDTRKVSWYQKMPKTSLQIIDSLELPKTAKIIDAGCGDSYLPDYLIQKGFTNITLVDISEKALSDVRKRLGNDKIEYVNADITCFIPNKKFDIWHDRAVSHFLNEEDDIKKYIETVTKYIETNGYLIIGTFSSNGPDQCSGLNVYQYSEKQLNERFNTSFKKIKCFTENHTTPSGSRQNFLFCVFQKK